MQKVQNRRCRRHAAVVAPGSAGDWSERVRLDAVRSGKVVFHGMPEFTGPWFGKRVAVGPSVPALSFPVRTLCGVVGGLVQLSAGVPGMGHLPLAKPNVSGRGN